MSSILRRSVAEMIGTFWLVFAGTGSAVLAAIFLKGPVQLGIGLLGVSLAFGLTVVTMAYAIGHVSGCHINPAVTVGLWAGGRFPGKDVPWYVVAQFVGGILGSALLYLILGDSNGLLREALSGGLASNGFGAQSPGGYGMLAAILIEIVMTFMFLFIIMGATRADAPSGFAGLAIGLGLTLIHLVAIPVDNCSVNPARSLAPALFAGGPWLAQVWLFILFPLIGGVLGGLAYRYLFALESRPDIVGDAE
jgi:aquaporin Z